MRFRVLGNASRYLAPLAGGSSYLVEAGGARVLLDCGPGAREALRTLGVERLDAVVLSHFHYDHALDLPTLGAMMDERTLLVLPPGEGPRLDALAKAYVFEGPFDVPGPILEADGELRAGSIRLRSARTAHSAPSIATRLEADGRALVYAGDTAPCDGLRELARGADALLAHTLLPRVEPSPHARVHLTAEAAGALAAEAGVGTLYLSHRFHGSRDEEMLAAAKAHPRVVLCETGGVYEA